jgi:RNA polymerase sigma-70 factor (ECF subfamily)
MTIMLISPSMVDSAELDQTAVEAAEEAFDAELVAGMSDAVESLSPASQLVVRMHYMEGMSHTEIAEALEISVGTVKSRLAYGLESLRKALRSR